MYTKYENKLRDFTRNQINLYHCCFLRKFYQYITKNACLFQAY